MTDVADEAAGEVIYSYEGDEDASIVTQPPPLSPSDPTAGQLEGGGMPTAPQAFESFAGKVYKPASVHGAFYAKTGSAQSETTLERLGRLQREMELLESDLKSSSGNSDAASGTPNSLLDTVQEMKARLAKVSEIIPPQQETLTANVTSAAASLQTPRAVPTSSSGVDGGSGSTSSGGAPITSTGSMLYSRLQRLENWIGAGGVGSSSSSALSAENTTCLSERLAALESTISKLDEKELDLKAKKAKVIRQDLEAASKARNKLMAGSPATTSSSASDSKTMTELHDLFIQLQGITPHLPLLTQRLQALSRQHQEAALQSAKLQALTALSQRLTTQVSSLEQAVNTTEQALVQTAEQMKQNIQALDEKLK